MSVRVRFSPSPTGHLHIGGARTALYNFLYAKKEKGICILRVEDTDQARSKAEYEAALMDDLAWLGLKFDEGPHAPGDHAPYRQSERIQIYQETAKRLITEKKAFYCFCSEDDLERKKAEAMAKNLAPHYDGTCRELTTDEVQKKLDAGESAVVRFRVPQKSYVLNDLVRGKVEFPQNMVGDFVILRSDGHAVYNYCCVVDDWKMKITHVIRGEDHLNNTVRQLMIYEALGAETLPQFAHVSLLVGADRQKLSKRHGDTAVSQYREGTYLPEAMNNYLVLLGWSHPAEKTIFTMQEAAENFSLDRFSKAPAVFDIEKFLWVNAQYLKELDPARIKQDVASIIPANHAYHNQSDEWKIECWTFLRDHIQCYKESLTYLDSFFKTKIEMDEQLKEIFGWETTPQIATFLKMKVEELSNKGIEFTPFEEFNAWADAIKKDLAIKGKPLFMGMRAALTGEAHGKELKTIVALTPLKILKERLEVTSAS